MKRQAAKRKQRRERRALRRGEIGFLGHHNQAALARQMFANGALDFDPAEGFVVLRPTRKRRSGRHRRWASAWAAIDTMRATMGALMAYYVGAKATAEGGAK